MIVKRLVRMLVQCIPALKHGPEADAIRFRPSECDDEGEDIQQLWAQHWPQGILSRGGRPHKVVWRHDAARGAAEATDGRAAGMYC